MAEGKKVSSVSFFNSRLTSIISISLVLFLLGLVFLIGLLGNKLSVYVKENISFSIVLKDNQKEADIKKMQKTLDALPYIKSTEYISKEQAVKELEEELGENPETFLGFNPLQASIEVKLHSEYANVDSLQLIEKKIKKYTSVSDLLYRKDMMQMVNDNVKRVSLILLTLAVMLMAISFVLISNTIRLLIYSKRFLIHTMKLVGASWGFIRRPFLVRNIWIGILAAAMADAKVGPVLKAITDKAAAARGDVAAAVKDNPALVAMMERAMQRMTVESMLKQAGTDAESIKQLNRVLQGIKKDV